MRNLFYIVCCTALAWSVVAHPSSELRLQALSAQIEAEPMNPALLLSRAREYVHAKQWLLAEQDLLVASELAGKDYVEFDLGLLSLAQNEFSQAKAHFEAHLKSSNTTRSLTLWHLSEISLELGNFDEALHYFDSYLANTQSPHPGNIAKAVKTASESRQVELALNWLDLGIQKVGQVPQLLRLREELIAEANTASSD
ncbi:MAG: hypothetical protein MI746_06000 [Pseudomonadales bacterium]|nr:hypothetical protein [Pseudomonadales bacterium]